MKKLILLLLACAAAPSWGGIYIYVTRVIYPAQRKEITVQLMNDDKQSSLVQSWIDDGDTSQPPEKIRVPFMLTPPVTRVAPGSGQQLKIKQLTNHLPKDRESLFYLNVLDIPPNNPAMADKNVLKFALQNRIKFIYRPQGITAVNKESFSRLNLRKTGGGLNIKNNSANWITIPTIAVKDKVNKSTCLLAPWSDTTVPVATTAQSYTVTLIDDHGNYLSEKIKTQ